MRRSHKAPLALASSAILGLALSLLGAPVAADEPLVTMGPSDADSVAVLSALPGYKNSYWWDHTDLTVAVLAAPNLDPQMVRAIHDAVATWRTVLASRLPIVSLTDVTATSRNPQSADIVVHYVPRAGGIVWGGSAVCGVQKCLNVIVRSDVPDHIDSGETDYDATRVYRLALHEIGHALGLGHAEPLEQSMDIMGYGWSLPDPDLIPILSDCDLEGIAAAFAWALDGEAPHPATIASVAC